jgi:hypothetical protein
MTTIKRDKTLYEEKTLHSKMIDSLRVHLFLTLELSVYLGAYLSAFVGVV